MNGASRINLYYRSSTGGNPDKWALRRTDGTHDVTAMSATQTHAAGSLVCLVGGGDATSLSLSVNGGTYATAADANNTPVLGTILDIASNGGANHLDGAVIAVALLDRVPTQAEATALATLNRPPLLGERVGPAMIGLWYGAQRIAWALPSTGTAIDLNDTDAGDFRLLGINGAGSPPVLHRSVETPLRDGAAYIEIGRAHV